MNKTWNLLMRRIAESLMCTTLAILFSCGSRAFSQAPGNVKSSLLLLIDASGSMGNEIGSGNSQAKIEAAKQAAIAALGRAAHSGLVEVAVLAFSGDCRNPVPSYQDFTRNVDRLTQFIGSLQPSGGTPMADALLFANRFMDKSGDAGASTRMILLLADGQNDCGSVGQAMASLKSSGVIFRHETVGFGITPNSQAAQDLRDIATQTGGTYHHAVDANQLADVFREFVDTFTVIDMLGTFGRPGITPSAASRRRKAVGTSQPARSPSVTGQVTDLLGLFKPKPAAPKANDLPNQNAPSGAALCYRQFSNPSGLAGIRDQYDVTEFTCADSCQSLGESQYLTAETQVDDPPGMTCQQQCNYAAGSAIGAAFVRGRSTSENHCVAVLDPLQPPVAVTHYYCDLSDNKHRVTWQTGTAPAGGFRVYLNHFPDLNHEAEFKGKTHGNTFDFEYGINFHDNPVVDGMNSWNPFPQVGVSACNRYGICTPVVYGDRGDCGR